MAFVRLNTFPLLAIILTVHVDQQRKKIICGKAFLSFPFCTRGVLLGILGGGVPLGSPNPDPISAPKCHFLTPVFRPGFLNPNTFSD